MSWHSGEPQKTGEKGCQGHHHVQQMEEAIPPPEQAWSICMPGASWPKSSLAGKDLEVLVDAKLTMGQEYACVAKMPSGTLSCFSQQAKGGDLSLYSTQKTHIWTDGLLSARYWFSGASLMVGSTCQEKHTHAEESPALEITRDCNTGASVSMGRGWEGWNCSAWRREGSVGVL